MVRVSEESGLKVLKPINEDFPEIKSLKFEGKEDKGDIYGKIFQLSETSLSAHPCSDKLCKNGGFRIGRILSNLIRTKKTKEVSAIQCYGHHTSGPHSSARPCYNMVHYSVTVEYFPKKTKE